MENVSFKTINLGSTRRTSAFLFSRCHDGRICFRKILIVVDGQPDDVFFLRK